MLNSFTSSNNNTSNLMSSAAVCGNGSSIVKTANGITNGVEKSDGTVANNNSSTHNVHHVNGATHSQSLEDKFTNMAYQDVKDNTAMLHHNVSSIMEKWKGMDKYMQQEERLTILTNLYNAVLNEKTELEHTLNTAQQNLHLVEECIRPYQVMEDPVVSRDGHTFDRKEGRSKPLPRSMQEQGNAAKTSSSSLSGSQVPTPSPTSTSVSQTESTGNKHDEMLFENKSLTTVLERLRNALNKVNHNTSNHSNSSNSNNNINTANSKYGNAVVHATSATIGNNNELGNTNGDNHNGNHDGADVTTVISDSINGNNSNNPITMHPQQAEVNARGELVHPCLRVYGYCNFHGTCSFANYPYDACLSHLKGKCRFGALCHERHVEFRGPLDSNGVLMEQSALIPTEQQQLQLQLQLQQQQEEEQQENEPYTSIQTSISALTLNVAPVFTVQPSN